MFLIDVSQFRPNLLLRPAVGQYAGELPEIKHHRESSHLCNVYAQETDNIASKSMSYLYKQESDVNYSLPKKIAVHFEIYIYMVQCDLSFQTVIQKNTGN